MTYKNLPQVTKPTLKTVAYLGPAGSYTEQALFKQFIVETPCPVYSITEVFRTLAAGEVDAGYVPLENMLQGPVSETLDLLSEYRHRIHIEASSLFSIEHCIGLLTGTNPIEQRKKNIKRIYSREHALRQCSRYLAENFKDAQLSPAASTSAAALEVKEHNSTEIAVVGGEQMLLDAGFEIIAKNIGDSSNNKTRFALLKAGDAVEKLGSFTYHCNSIPGIEEQEWITSIVVDPGRDRQGLLFEILQVISVDNHVNLLSIHSRPDAKGGFVFHLDLEGQISDPRIAQCLSALEKYCLEHTLSTAEIIVCGSYSREKFDRQPFKSVGIIGGYGKMGQWFNNFFTQSGIKVILSDLNQGDPIETLIDKCDVLLLSVPMSVAKETAEKLKGRLKSGQLLVENCSIKSCALPSLIEAAPPGCEVLGIHTMFGGDTTSVRGENIIISKTEKSGKKAQAFEDLLYKHGAKITQASIEEHDRITAVVQSLIQLALISLAEVIRQSFPSAELIDPFTTPNSRPVLLIMKRILKQNEHLIGDLHTLNNQYPEMRRTFLKILNQHCKALDNQDISQLLESLKKSRDFNL